MRRTNPFNSEGVEASPRAIQPVKVAATIIARSKA
jgi:hypothetical protein